MGKLKPIFLFKSVLSEDGINYQPVIDPPSQQSFNEWSINNSNQLRKFSPTRVAKKSIRSVEQNRYYFGVVLKIIAEGEGYIGPGEKDELHEALKARFLIKPAPFGGYMVERTSKLDTETFELYLSAIRQWYQHWRGVRIPLPNEVDVDDNVYTKL